MPFVPLGKITPNCFALTGKSPGGRGNAEVSRFGQKDVLHPHAHFEVAFVVAHAVVEEDRQHVVKVLDLDLDRKGLVPEVPQATCQLLSGSVVLMVIILIRKKRRH